MLLPEEVWRRKERSNVAGKDTETVVSEGDPIVPFLIKDFDQEWPHYCAEFSKSELHGSFENRQ